MNTTATVRCSVLIAARNVEPYIRSSIESVLDQLKPGDELVAVDDCSSDATATILEEYEGVTVVHNDRPLSSSGARNRAAAEATGDLLVFLDGDDVALPGRLERHRTAAASGAGLSYGRIALFDEAGRLVKWHRGSARKSRVPLVRQITFENPIPFSAAAITALDFARVGGFDETVPSSEDWDFWARALHEGLEVEAIDEYVTAYRLRRMSKSMDWRAKYQAYLEVRRLIVDSTDSAGDPVAASGFKRRLMYSTAINAWRRARLTREYSAYRAAVCFAVRALVAEGRFRWQLTARRAASTES